MVCLSDICRWHILFCNAITIHVDMQGVHELSEYAMFGGGKNKALGKIGIVKLRRMIACSSRPLISLSIVCFSNLI